MITGTAEIRLRVDFSTLDSDAESAMRGILSMLESPDPKTTFNYLDVKSVDIVEDAP